MMKMVCVCVCVYTVVGHVWWIWRVWTWGICGVQVWKRCFVSLRWWRRITLKPLAVYSYCVPPGSFLCSGLWWGYALPVYTHLTGSMTKQIHMEHVYESICLFYCKNISIYYFCHCYSSISVTLLSLLPPGGDKLSRHISHVTCIKKIYILLIVPFNCLVIYYTVLLLLLLVRISIVFLHFLFFSLNCILISQ